LPRRVPSFFVAREPKSAHALKMRPVPPNSLPRSVNELVGRYDGMILGAELSSRGLSVFRNPAKRAKALVQVKKVIRKRNELIRALSSLNFYGEALQRKKGEEGRAELETGFAENKGRALELFEELRLLTSQGIFKEERNRLEQERNDVLKEKIRGRLEDSRSRKNPNLPQ